MYVALFWVFSLVPESPPLLLIGHRIYTGPKDTLLVAVKARRFSGPFLPLLV